MLLSLLLVIVDPLPCVVPAELPALALPPVAPAFPPLPPVALPLLASVLPPCEPVEDWPWLDPGMPIAAELPLPAWVLPDVALPPVAPVAVALPPVA